MKNRIALAGFCLSGTLLLGVFLGRLPQPADVYPAPDRTTLPSRQNDGWQFTSGQQTGPSASVSAVAAASESIDAPPHSKAESTEQTASAELPDEPDRAWFPEAIDSAGISKNAPESAQGALASGTEERIWERELSHLPEAQVREILQLRKELGSVAAETLGLNLASEVSSSAAPGVFPMPVKPGELRPIPSGQTSAGDPSITLASATTGGSAAERLLREAEACCQLNMINLKTPGYKRVEIVLLKAAVPKIPALEAEKSLVPISDSEGQGDTTDPVCWMTRLDLSQGELVETSNLLDIAVNGPGWLTVERGERREYVRTGMLGVDDERRLTIWTGAGQLPLSPAVNLPESSGNQFRFAANGDVFILGKEQNPEPVGQIVVVDFADPSSLRRTDSGTFSATDESGKPQESHVSAVLQGVLEQSNVDRERETADIEHLRTVASMILNAQ